MCYALHIQKLFYIRVFIMLTEYNSIAFLDLTITRRHTTLYVDIHRKPTTKDITINFLSNHPIEQKMAAFRFHITRMHSLPLNPDKKQTE